MGPWHHVGATMEITLDKNMQNQNRLWIGGVLEDVLIGIIMSNNVNNEAIPKPLPEVSKRIHALRSECWTEVLRRRIK